MPQLTINAGAVAGLLGLLKTFDETPEMAMARRVAAALKYDVPFKDSDAMAHGRAQEPNAIATLKDIITAKMQPKTEEPIEFAAQRSGPRGVVYYQDPAGAIFSCKPDLWVRSGTSVAACEIKSPYKRQDDPSTLRDRPYDMSQVFMHLYICSKVAPLDWPHLQPAQSLLYFVYPARYMNTQDLTYERIDDRDACPYKKELQEFYNQTLPQLYAFYKKMQALVYDRNAGLAFIKEHLEPESRPPAPPPPPPDPSPPRPAATTTTDTGGITVAAVDIHDFKRIKIARAALNATGTIIIKGQNGAGKTSFVQGALIALTGNRDGIEEPIRRGASKAVINLKLTNGYDITVTYTPSNRSGRLDLKDSKGTPLPSPRATLDAILQQRTIDPVAFIQKTPRERRADLLHLAGLDINAYEDKHKTLIAERQAAHRAWDTARKGLAQYPPLPGGKPTVKEDITTLMKRHGELQTQQTDAARAEDLITEAANLYDGSLKEPDLCKQLLKFIEHESPMAGITTELDELADTLKTATAQQAVAQKHQQRATAEQTLDQATVAYDNAKQAVKDVEAERDQKLATASLPIDGLAITETDLTYKGIAFSDASDGEQLKIALSIAMALNPTLRVILVREASLLDENAIQFITEQAEAKDYQIWLAMVGEPDDNTDGAIHITDGAITQ